MGQGSSRLPAWASPLRFPQFRRLISVILAQNIGFWFIFPGLQLTIAGLTDNDPMALSLLFFVTMSPILVLSLKAGAILDAHDRIRILNLGQSLIVVMALVTAAVVMSGRAPVWLIMLCSSSIGLAFSITLPAQQALLANAVPPEELSQAVTLNAMSLNLARTGGPGLAAIAIGLFGAGGSIVAFAVTGAIGLWLTRGLTLPRHAQRSSQDRSVTIGDGLRHVRDRRRAALSLGLVAVASLFGMSYVTQTPVIASTLSDSETAFLVIVSAGGLGSLIGIFLVARSGSRAARLNVAAASMVVLGAMVVVFGVSTSLILTVVVALVAGATQFALTTICNVIIQTSVEDEFRGRATSMFMVAWGGLIPVGGLVLGAMIAGIGLTWALAISGVITAVFASWAWWVQRHWGHD